MDYTIIRDNTHGVIIVDNKEELSADQEKLLQKFAQFANLEVTN